MRANKDLTQMIEYIRGNIADLTPAEAIIETAGVGYQLFISLNTYSALQGKQEAKLYTFEAIREDAHLLYGFATKHERELFTHLINISGIGGQTARALLSAFSPAELINAIQAEDVRMIKSVKGIGPKAAQRIVVELRDKVAALSEGSIGATGSGGTRAGIVHNELAKEATRALTTLGFPPAIVHKTVTAILQTNPTSTVEEIIKQALKML